MTSLWGMMVLGGIIGIPIWWVGVTIDHGNRFGGWSLFLGGIGTLIGIYVGYKAYKAFIE